MIYEFFSLSADAFGLVQYFNSVEIHNRRG